MNAPATKAGPNRFFMVVPPITSVGIDNLRYRTHDAPRGATYISVPLRAMGQWIRLCCFNLRTVTLNDSTITGNTPDDVANNFCP